MNPGILFLLCMLGFAIFIGLVPAIGMNIDRIAVAFLSLFNAPVYEEARRIAALIYQHPEQWKTTSYTLRHPRIGDIWAVSSNSLHVEGNGFGRWDPNFIERRIIYNAVAWYRRDYIKHLLTQVLNAPALNVPASG